MDSSLQNARQLSSPAARLSGNFRLVRLCLAREPGHPEGDPHHGYDILVPLREDGGIDVDVYKGSPSACRVRRFRPGEDDSIGRLVHGPGGAWLIQYQGAAAPDPEVGFHFRDERFVIGEYVSIREDDGGMHTFRVWEVRRP